MKIFTYAFNHPTYLIYQNKCLRKFVKEPFDFYCIDNASEQKFSDQFKLICQNNNIHYIKNEEPDHSLAGQSHYSALQWSWNNIISLTEEICVMTDHDTFAIDYLSIKDLLGDNCLAGFHQARGPKLEYFHPSLMIFNTKNMPNKNTISFKGALINDGDEDQITDIGGELYYYFRDNIDVKRNKLKCGH